MTTDAELVQQQIEAARAANLAYMQAKESGVPIPISQNPTIAPGSYVVPTMSSDVANTSKEQLWRESQAYAAYYGGMSAESIMNQRLESIPVSQRYLDLVSQYGQQHFNIVGSSGVLQYNQSGSYTYGAGYSNEMQGLPFQANTLTTYQSQSLDSILNSPSPMVRDLLNVRGLQTMDTGILSGSINTRINNWQTASNLSGFLTSPEERKPYEDWYWGSGPANARTAMDAVFLGRGEGALYAPPPGSVTERFGFDEFGKVLRGDAFSPATRGDNPFNPKMGSGDYRYVGEYRYNTGETVSRFYEKNVGSFVDFTKFGVMSEPFVGVRGGGSPGAFRETRDFTTAMNSIPALPDAGKTVFSTTQAAAYVQDVGGLPAPFRSSLNQPSQQADPLSLFQTGFRMGLTQMSPALGMASGAVIGAIRNDQSSMPFANVNTSGVFEAYESINKELAPYTTDIIGIGRTLKTLPDIKNGGIPGEIVNFGKGLYVGASQAPLDIAAMFAGGEAFTFGKGLIKTAVAKGAMSGLPTIGTAGRALSSPFAGDVARVAEAGFGAFIVASAGMNIWNQPTSTKKGETAGRTLIQFGGFGAGAGHIKPVEPDNYYAGRGFFSGKPEFGPVEKAQFKLETGIRALKTSQPAAYKEIATITLPGRMIEPAVKAEPDFTMLSKSGPYAKEIKSTIMEQPHSVIGSSAFIQQYPKPIAESAGLRTGKDVDLLIESPSKALGRLSQLSGLPEAEARGVMDVHPIPPNYPGLKASTEADITPPESSLLTRMFGDPYRHIAFPRGTSEVIKPGRGYIGDLTYEASQVQFGRKASGVSMFIEDPLKMGYRGEKDIYDFVTGYQAQRAVGISKGIPEKSFAESDRAMESFMNREFTFGTVKGQTAGDRNPIFRRSVRDIVDVMSKQAGRDRDIMRSGRELPGRPEVTFRSDVSKPGILSNALKYAAPSGGPGDILSSMIAISKKSLWSHDSIFGSSPKPPSSPERSAGSGPSSPRSSPLFGMYPDISPYLSSPGSAPGSSPGSPSIIRSGPPSSFPSPGSPSGPKPPGSNPSIFSNPGTFPPPPSPAPSVGKPPGSPVSPPTSNPTTSNPPSKPPSKPPIITEIPPTFSPPPGMPQIFGGGGGTRPGSPLGLKRWKRKNPVPDLPYLSAGMSVFSGGKKNGKKGRSLFGGGPF